MRGKFSLLEVIVVIFMIGLLSSIFMVVLSSHREQARRTACANQLRAFGSAMFMYADVPANGIFPTCSTTQDPFASPHGAATLNLMYRGYVADPKVFSCPSNPISAAKLQAAMPTVNNGCMPAGAAAAFATSYGYDPGHSPKDDSLTALMADTPGASGNSDNHGANGGQNVLLVGGAVEWRTNATNTLKDGSVDKSIFELNPEIPRKNDGFIRP